MRIENTIERLRQKNPDFGGLTDDAFQVKITEWILSTPYKKADDHFVRELMGDDYFPGLFYLHERKGNPSFLFDEPFEYYDAWVRKKFEQDLIQLRGSKQLSSLIALTGADNIIGHAMNILQFGTKYGKPLEDILVNQEYSDFFRRILMLVLQNDPFFICNNQLEFNNKGKEIVPLILEMTSEYGFHERLLQSILSGVIGIDIKDQKINTSPVSLSGTFSLPLHKEALNTIKDFIKKLEAVIFGSSRVGIDCFDTYHQQVISSSGLQVCWITDDYIQTMFELKFMEEQMAFNESLFFTVIPRYDSYSNDASYHDILEMLNLEIFEKLRCYYESGRFSICRNGMDISTFDGYRISREAYEAVKESGVVVISGARAYEMSQGMNKTTYYTGIAVCKSYTETITGFAKESGALIFLRQAPGEKSFKGFRDRAWRREESAGVIFPVAAFTASKYASSVLGKAERLITNT